MSVEVRSFSVCTVPNFGFSLAWEGIFIIFRWGIRVQWPSGEMLPLNIRGVELELMELPWFGGGEGGEESEYETLCTLVTGISCCQYYWET